MEKEHSAEWEAGYRQGVLDLKAKILSEDFMRQLSEQVIDALKKSKMSNITLQ